MEPKPLRSHWSRPERGGWRISLADGQFPRVQAVYAERDAAALAASSDIAANPSGGSATLLAQDEMLNAAVEPGDVWMRTATQP